MSNRKNTNRAIVRCKAMRHMRPNPYGILLSGVCVFNWMIVTCEYMGISRKTFLYWTGLL